MYNSLAVYRLQLQNVETLHNIKQFTQYHTEVKEVPVKVRNIVQE